jgi:hypothetical protein
MGYDLIGTVHSGSKRWWIIMVYLTFFFGRGSGSDAWAIICGSRVTCPLPEPGSGIRPDFSIAFIIPNIIHKEYLTSTRIKAIYMLKQKRSIGDIKKATRVL